jgi:hypothetical protein
MRRPAAKNREKNSDRTPNAPLMQPMVASRLASWTVEGVAGPRPRSVAGGGDE